MSYDANGNRTSDGTSTYSYDQANRLTANLTTTYAYDGDGLRTKKTPLLGAEPYTWDVAAPIPEIIGDADTAYITGPDGLPLEQITSNGTVHYYHQDQLGSTRAITDQTGAVSATTSYDSYGNPASQTGSLTNPFGYAGQYTDSETGLQYLRARYYDPNTQNLLTPRPHRTDHPRALQLRRQQPHQQHRPHRPRLRRERTRRRRRTRRSRTSTR